MKKFLLPGLAIVIAAFFWGMDGVVLRPALYSLPVELVVFIEHLLVFLLFTPFIIKHLGELRRLGLADWGSFGWVALFGGVLGTLFITKALFYVEFAQLSVVILMQQLQPLFALILARLFLKERMPKKFFGWAIVAIIATYFIVFDGAVPNLGTGDKTPIAALLGLGAAFAWGSSTVFSKRALEKVSFVMGAYVRFLLTTVLMFIVVAATGVVGELQAISIDQWKVFVLIIFSSGGVAMLLYMYGLKRIPASTSTVLELTYPLSAVALEYLIHGRSLSVVQWGGAIVLLLAMYKVSGLQKK